VSVVICTYTDIRLRSLQEAVTSVLHQNLNPHEIIIAVDNNRALYDVLKADLSVPAKIVLNVGRRGLSATRNVAIREGSGDFVAFMDDDAIADASWLDRLIEPFEDPEVAAVSGRTILRWPGRDAPSWFPEELDFVFAGTFNKRFTLDDSGIRNVGGCNCAFRRLVFDSVGFWDERLGRGQTKTGGEEAELCLRIRARMPGARILFADDAVVYHEVSLERARLSYVLGYCFQEGRTRALLAERARLHSTRPPLRAEYHFARTIFQKNLPKKVLTSGERAQGVVLFLGLLLAGFGYCAQRSAQIARELGPSSSHYPNSIGA
jgi:GT2 family glycosyltransferase